MVNRLRPAIRRPGLQTRRDTLYHRVRIRCMVAGHVVFRAAAVLAAVLAGSSTFAQPVRRQPGQRPAPAPSFFTTPLAIDQMRGKQAVIVTGAGEVVIQLLPEAAPNHVGYFMKLAQEGAYDGTTFHRLIKYGIIQGGDPLSKDPDKRALYGTGGLGVLEAEVSAEQHTAGTLSAVIQPASPTPPAPSSSSASRHRPRSMGSTPSSGGFSRASRSCRSCRSHRSMPTGGPSIAS